MIPMILARPLNALFQVSHTFLLSWQLELLSAQASALRRGAWTATATMAPAAEPNRSSRTAALPTGSAGQDISVTPVQFFDDRDGRNELTIGVVSVSFWRIDDTYGPPSMAELDVSGDTGRKAVRFCSLTNQLTLSVRAVANVGIVASLSGFGATAQPTTSASASTSGDNRAFTAADRAVVREIGHATCDSLALSMSDALLAATQWCAGRKCIATARALQPVLHPWIVLSVDGGSIAVAAAVQYHGAIAGQSSTCDAGAPILFRLTCDARSGSFVTCFPRQCALLRELASNTWDASESMALHIASLPKNRRRMAGAFSSGRLVRDAFEGLARSMNVLGQRVGVGGLWDDIDEQSSLLRQRAVHAACMDAHVSLVRSCGMASLYGLGALATGAALGLDAVPDMYVRVSWIGLLR
jgi:hypothetical protein